MKTLGAAPTALRKTALNLDGDSPTARGQLRAGMLVVGS